MKKELYTYSPGVEEEFTSAIRSGDVGTMRRLLESRSISPSGNNRHGRGWLQFSTLVGVVESCKLLLEYGSSAFECDELGVTASELAIKNEKHELISLYSPMLTSSSEDKTDNTKQSLAEEIFDALGLDAQSVQVINGIANVLIVQALLHRNRPGFNVEMQSKFARGYLFGFFDAAIQGLDFSDDSEEESLLRIIAAHACFFHDHSVDVIQYVKNSIELQDDAVYKKSHQQGVDELHAFLGKQQSQPLGLARYFLLQDGRVA